MSIQFNKLKNLLIAHFIFAFGLITSAYSSFDTDPVAFVYAGSGVCRENCAESFTDLLRQAGFIPVLVTESEINSSLFNRYPNAKIWVQPGGESYEFSRSWTPEMKNLIKKFISSGKGYLGVCAGAFFADDYVDVKKSLPGLGLWSGNTLNIPDSAYYSGSMILPVLWSGRQRGLYFEDGGYFKPKTNAIAPNFKVIASYKSKRNLPAVIEFSYGLGKVSLSLVHPEAPLDWILSAQNAIQDDGTDFDLALSLIHGLIR